MTGLEDPMSGLVERLRRGDAEAASLLDRTYRTAIFRFAWGYLRSPEDAEDAVQQIFCKVLAARTAPDEFRPWLYRIARNHCLNVLRARRRRKDAAPVPDLSWADSLTGPSTRALRAERRERLRSAIATLSLEQQEVLRLRYGEALSRREVAAVLEIPESLVKSRLYEAMRRLREHGSLAP